MQRLGPSYQDKERDEFFSNWPTIRDKSSQLKERSIISGRIQARMSPNHRLRWLMGAALVFVLAGFWYRNHLNNEDARSGGRRLAIPVRVALVQRRDLAVVERTIGTVVANISVQVTPQVQGMLQSENFQKDKL